MEKETGKRRTLWLSNDLDDKAETIRKKLGLSRSGFLRYCVVEVVKDFAVAQETTK